MSRGVIHYMQKQPPGGALQGEVDIEQVFAGLKYSKCEGLEKRGKRKNVYTEQYANSDTLRVWQGKDITREATTITFTFYAIGSNRQKVIDDFYEYVNNGKIYYYDTIRRKKAYMILQDEFDISDDKYYGSVPYKEVKVKFQNLWGECKNC